MAHESVGTSQDYRDDDDEDEYEDAGGGNRLLGFMFGNVDCSGDLDVDYLDKDAKEQLSALADKLGPSLTDMDLSAKSPQTPADAAEQDYHEKAEDAVDYEDIDEKYEGPETQATSEEDYLLPKKMYFSTEASLVPLQHSTSVFDDDNYDEEEESEKEPELLDTGGDVQDIPSSVLSEGEKGLEDNQKTDSFGAESLEVELQDLLEDEPEIAEDLQDDNSSTPLPVLCIEDGAVILRFSEIFCNHEPLKRREKKDKRYLTNREKYMSMDNTSLDVEEDEEKFLKAFPPGFSLMRHSRAIQDDLSGTEDEDFESVKSGFFPGVPMIPSQVDQQRKEPYAVGTPMKEDSVADLTSNWSTPLSPTLYSLDQQNWEELIIWDDSPTRSGNPAESCETSVSSDDFLSLQTEREVELQKFQAELPMKSDESDHASYLRSCPVMLESFGSEESLGRADVLPGSRYHPQLLRLESESDPTSSLNGKKDSSGMKDNNRIEAINRFSKLTSQNRDIVEGSWLNRIIWEQNQSFVKPKLILDLQDEEMLFEILDNKEGKLLRRHAGSMFITSSVTSMGGGESIDPHGHGGQSGARFNISNDKFYSNRKISQQLKTSSKKRAAHGVKVLHSVPALKLQTMKPKLSNKDIANFHRPKALWYPHDNEALKEQGNLPAQGPMKIILKSLGGKGSKLHVDAEETVASVKAKASRKLDFKPSEPVKIFYSGRELEDQNSLAAEDVRPNSLLHLVRTRIHSLPRAQKVPGENKSLRPPGAFKKKSDLSVKDGHVFLMEYCEERPLLLGNVGMGARLCTYYQKSSPGDQTGNLLRNGNNSSLGSVLTLDPVDKSPFLGDIKSGCNQSCLETNMYRAPIFSHKVSSTDYLLVRSPKGKLSIRRIDRLDVVGQQEPHMEVMSPGSKGVQNYIMNRLLVYMYREFSAVEKRGLLPCIRADELSAQFPAMSEAFLRKRLKHCADLQRGSNGQLFWVMRRGFRIPLEEELRRMVTPENVSAYESMQAGLYRLKRLGITRLTLPTGLSSAMNQLPDEAIALAAASHIERELQITPWNLSSNFVACTTQDRGNIERLEITGVGDPSGRGLGFSYVRTAPKPPISNAMVKKKAAAARTGSTVTGTDADLRRLSMSAAREVLRTFNVPEEQIMKQTRWHRIAMIRKLSSEQAASGVKVDATTISKYARGQRMSFLQLQQQTREKCQEIWDRQVQYLSAVDGDDYESETEANSDLDSFAGDLENLLDAEEFEDGEEGNYESKHVKLDGVRGLKMRRRPLQAHAEEEIEDEAAEAAELCRMLMDDEEAERRKKKKTRAAGEEVVLTAAPSNLGFGSESVQRGKKISTTVKKIASTIPQNEYSTAKEIITQEQKKEEKNVGKKNLSGKTKVMNKNDDESMPILNMNKKLKILNEPIQFVKEKKSAREKFVCGACGVLGHMKTNKMCPKYGKDSEKETEVRDLEKATGRSINLDNPRQPQQRTVAKKVPKSAMKSAPVEVLEDEKASSKAKVLKVKCSSTEKHTPTASQSSDRVAASDTENTIKPVVKVNKIIFSNKMKSEEAPIEPQKPSIVIKPPVEADRDQPRKIIIKRPKEIINVDPGSHEGGGYEYRKMKKIIDISSFEKRSENENRLLAEEAARRRSREDTRLLKEEEKRRIAEREKEERNRRLYDQKRILEEQERLSEIRRYEEAIRTEREEEERQKAKKKKKFKVRSEPRDDYFEELRPKRNDRRPPERSEKRRPVVELGRYGAEYVPPTKRRRGGEVGLANILENMVETLKDRYEVSYLFLKPVSKKEAPDYLDIIKHPMDLSTIKEKVRRLEYKSREEFRHDVWQITCNAHIYNDGRNPGIPPLADQLLELCDYLLEENDVALTEAEAGIEYEK